MTKKTTTKGGEDELTEVLTIRVSPGDLELLDEVLRQQAIRPKRGAIAREALRRGLESLKAGRR